MISEAKYSIESEALKSREHQEAVQRYTQNSQKGSEQSPFFARSVYMYPIKKNKQQKHPTGEVSSLNLVMRNYLKPTGSVEVCKHCCTADCPLHKS